MKGLFAGISTVDIQLYINEYPDSNTKNKALSTRVDIGGPAANAAVTFALLGGEAKLVTMIGEHEFRDFMLRKLHEHGIEVIDIVDDMARDAPFSVIISSLNNGERTVFVSPALKEDKKTNEISTEDFEICLVDGYLAETANKMAAIAKDSGKITVLDGGSWKTGMEKYLKNIDYAVCSSDFYPPECKNHDEVIRFLQDYGIKNIAITRGEKSIVVYTNDRKGEIPVNKVSAVDTLGAGDVFHGALCYYLPGDHNFVSALKHASDIATESCKYHGVQAWSFKFVKRK
jgi:sugar/nucleoside kinase (ribokinase family)